MRNRNALVATVVTVLVSLLGVVFLGGCGNGSAAAVAPAEPYPVLRDFQLVRGQPAAITIRVDRPEVRLIVELANHRDGRANQSLRFTMERLTAVDTDTVAASPVALAVKPHPGSSYTLYVGHTTADLKPGWYRLILDGAGRLLSVSVAQV
jgi:hypothetical protein